MSIELNTMVWAVLLVGAIGPHRIIRVMRMMRPW